MNYDKLFEDTLKCKSKIVEFDNIDDYEEEGNANLRDLMNLINNLEEEDYNEVADMILDYMDNTYVYESDIDEENLQEGRTIRISKHTDKKVLKKAARKRRTPKEKAKARKKAKLRKKKRCGPGMAPNHDGKGCHRVAKTIGKTKRG